MTNFAYEITDTFGGEANYCWVKRGTVRARSMRGAIRAIKAREGIPARHFTVYDCGDERRIDFRGWTVCAFINIAGE